MVIVRVAKKNAMTRMVWFVTNLEPCLWLGRASQHLFVQTLMALLQMKELAVVAQQLALLTVGCTVQNL